MDITSVIIGLVGGLVIGYGIGFVMAKRKATELEDELASAKKELQSIKKTTGKELDANKAKLSEAEKKLEQAKQEAARHRQALEEQTKNAAAERGQLEQLQASIQELETARAKAAELADAHQQGRVQAEGRMKQAEKLAEQSRDEVHKLETQIQQLVGEKERLKEQTERQGKEIQRIRAEGSSVKGDAASSGLEQSVEAFGTADGSLEGVLNVLLEAEGQTAAVLADTNGIVVSAVGDKNLRDGIAATSRLVDSLIQQLEGMVPFTTLRAYCLQDEASNVLTGRAFKCAGEVVGLATFGPRPPADRVMDGAQANLSAILE